MSDCFGSIVRIHPLGDGESDPGILVQRRGISRRHNTSKFSHVSKSLNSLFLLSGKCNSFVSDPSILFQNFTTSICTQMLLVRLLVSLKICYSPSIINGFISPRTIFPQKYRVHYLFARLFTCLLL